MSALEYGRVFIEPILTVFGGTGPVIDQTLGFWSSQSQKAVAEVYHGVLKWYFRANIAFVEKEGPGYLEIHGDREPWENRQLVPANMRYCY